MAHQFIPALLRRRIARQETSSLAMLLGVDRATVSGWRAGRWLPSFNALSAIAEQTNIPIDALLDAWARDHAVHRKRLADRKRQRAHRAAKSNQPAPTLPELTKATPREGAGASSPEGMALPVQRTPTMTTVKDDILRRLTRLEEENRSLALTVARLSDAVKSLQSDPDDWLDEPVRVSTQAKRKPPTNAERPPAARDLIPRISGPWTESEQEQLLDAYQKMKAADPSLTTYQLSKRIAKRGLVPGRMSWNGIYSQLLQLGAPKDGDGALQERIRKAREAYRNRNGVHA